MSGLYTVFKKELQDDFTSWRFIILFTLVLLSGVFALYIAAQTIRQTVTGSTEFVFLALFYASGDTIPFSFLSFMTMFVPIVGIALGFDAINSERNQGTLSRLVSQPIYRDTIINAKFLAGVTTIGIMMLTLVMLVSGLGMRMIGLPPTAEEAWRLLFFLVVTIIYGSFWLGLAILFSILFRRVATSALATFAIWVFVQFLFNPIGGAIAGVISPITDSSTMAQKLAFANLNLSIAHVSPVNLFQESMQVLLIPGMRTYSQMFQIVAGGGQYMLPTPLSMGQSLITIWPYLITLIMLTIICFAASYIKFMREEIRAT